MTSWGERQQVGFDPSLSNHSIFLWSPTFKYYSKCLKNWSTHLTENPIRVLVWKCTTYINCSCYSTPIHTHGHTKIPEQKKKKKRIMDVSTHCRSYFILFFLHLSPKEVWSFNNTIHRIIKFRFPTSQTTALLYLLAHWHSLLEHLKIEEPPSILSATPLLFPTSRLWVYRGQPSHRVRSCVRPHAMAKSYRLNVYEGDDTESGDGVNLIRCNSHGDALLVRWRGGGGGGMVTTPWKLCRTVLKDAFSCLHSTLNCREARKDILNKAN